MFLALNTSIWLALPLGVALWFVLRTVDSVLARQRSRDRLFGEGPAVADAPPMNSPGSSHGGALWGSWLERWLFISGFRGPFAVGGFLLLEGLALVTGIAIALLVTRLGVLEIGIEWLEEIPGGVGDLLVPVLQIAPWTVVIGLALLPVARVRARRRDIVSSVERDLPMTLALLATLVESGLGLDAALARVLESIDPERPFARELRGFQAESRAGLPRVACYRALAQRLDVVSVSTFASALIHAEHIGGGVAESLRRQADEVWSRRRELAIQRAQTLPTKLAVPLVVCFLPGIFVHTFGPALAEFLRIAEGVLAGPS